ncbi:hypothetical protein [Methylophilus luteus]|uniref:Uncharacterized protein n=1 Tax=Methylophilus luteus TaxID=640108 RepID=A0ABW3F541_9PROT
MNKAFHANPFHSNLGFWRKTMEVKDWITIVSALIVAIGWFVTGYLNRVKDVAQKRLEYRLKALEAFLVVWFAIQKNSAPFTQPEFLTQLEDARSKFQLYGFKDEIEWMEKLVSAMEKQNVPAANEMLRTLVPLVRVRIRNELKIAG